MNRLQGAASWRLWARTTDWVPSGKYSWPALVAALYAGLVVWFTYPLASVAGSHVLFEPADDQLWIMGILEWQRHALFEQPDRFFAGHFYYGAGNALFGSDLLLGLLPLSAPIAWLTDNPILAFNAAYMGSMFLNALAMYAAARTIVPSRAGAFLAGVIYAFGPLQLALLTRVQFGPAWWLPLALLFAVRFARGYRWPDAALAVAMVWLQFVTTLQLGLHAALVVAAFAGPPALWRIATRRDWKLAAQLLGVGVAGAAIFAPIMWGYLDYSSAWNLERHISEVQSRSAHLRDYLAVSSPLRDYLPPTSHLHWYDLLKDHFKVVPVADRRLFLGFLPLALALLGAGVGLVATGAEPGRRRIAITLLILGVGGVLLSLGPNWHWRGEVTDVELPYRALYDTFLPFRAIRFAARFSLLTHVAVALLAAVGLAAALQRLRFRPRLSAISGLAVAGLVIFEAWPSPITVYPTPERPEVLAALREARDGPVLFVPVATRQEIEWTWLAALARSGPVVNGSSAHTWRHTWYFKDMTQGRSVTEADSLAAGLSAFGVRTVLLEETPLLERARRVWAAVRASPHVESATMHGDFWRIRLRPPSIPLSRDWTDLRADFLVTTVPPDAGMISALVLENASDRPWAPPGGDSRIRRLQLEWIGPDGTVELHFESDVLPPPFLMSGQVHRQPLRIVTPLDSGAYRLRGRMDGAVVFDQPVRVAPVTPNPFLGSSEGLQAELRLRTPAQFEVPAGDAIPVHVDALNTGEVSWEEPAVIRLGWRLFKQEADGSERELPGHERRLPLLAHEYTPTKPGAGYAFAGVLIAPSEPGRYVARLSMLAELVAWFDIAPIEIRILVAP